MTTTHCPECGALVMPCGNPTSDGKSVGVHYESLAEWFVRDIAEWKVTIYTSVTPSEAIKRLRDRAVTLVAEMDGHE